MLPLLLATLKLPLLPPMPILPLLLLPTPMLPLLLPLVELLLSQEQLRLPWLSVSKPLSATPANFSLRPIVKLRLPPTPPHSLADPSTPPHPLICISSAILSLLSSSLLSASQSKSLDLSRAAGVSSPPSPSPLPPPPPPPPPPPSPPPPSPFLPLPSPYLLVLSHTPPSLMFPTSLALPPSLLTFPPLLVAPSPTSLPTPPSVSTLQAGPFLSTNAWLLLGLVRSGRGKAGNDGEGEAEEGEGPAEEEEEGETRASVGRAEGAEREDGNAGYGEAAEGEPAEGEPGNGGRSGVALAARCRSKELRDRPLRTPAVPRTERDEKCAALDVARRLRWGEEGGKGPRGRRPRGRRRRGMGRKVAPPAFACAKRELRLPLPPIARTFFSSLWLKAFRSALRAPAGDGGGSGTVCECGMTKRCDNCDSDGDLDTVAPVAPAAEGLATAVDECCPATPCEPPVCRRGGRRDAASAAAGAPAAVPAAIDVSAAAGAPAGAPAAADCAAAGRSGELESRRSSSTLG
ncbi:unnamed protein product [Closterium sp. NIES-53]